MKKTIEAKVNVGDAGIPFDVSVTIWYEVIDGIIFIRDSEDEGGPENQPLWWPNRIRQVIEDEFENQKVVFEE